MTELACNVCNTHDDVFIRHYAALFKTNKNLRTRAMDVSCRCGMHALSFIGACGGSITYYMPFLHYVENCNAARIAKLFHPEVEPWGVDMPIIRQLMDVNESLTMELTTLRGTDWMDTMARHIREQRETTRHRQLRILFSVIHASAFLDVFIHITRSISAGVLPSYSLCGLWAYATAMFVGALYGERRGYRYANILQQPLLTWTCIYYGADLLLSLVMICKR